MRPAPSESSVSTESSTRAESALGRSDLPASAPALSGVEAKEPRPAGPPTLPPLPDATCEGVDSSLGACRPGPRPRQLRASMEFVLSPQLHHVHELPAPRLCRRAAGAGGTGQPPPLDHGTCAALLFSTWSVPLPHRPPSLTAIWYWPNALPYIYKDTVRPQSATKCTVQWLTNVALHSINRPAWGTQPGRAARVVQQRQHHSIPRPQPCLGSAVSSALHMGQAGGRL